eukprot:1285483-Alexandrium_andersonii.AAC.1
MGSEASAWARLRSLGHAPAGPSTSPLLAWCLPSAHGWIFGASATCARSQSASAPRTWHSLRFGFKACTT